jgi:hypothetical protein
MEASGRVLFLADVPTLSGGNEENCKIHQSRFPISRLKSETRTSLFLLHLQTDLAVLCF